MALEVERDGDSSLALDDRYFPLLISKWNGKPTQALAEAYFRWHDLLLGRAEFYELKVIHITDANHAKQPDAPVRKFIAEASAQRSHVADHAINSYVTLKSKMVRGVLTVIGWVMGDSKSNPIMTPTIQEALELALQDLDKAKIARPRGLEPARYELSDQLPVAS